ncbi:hypothetical protein NQ314_005119 [Rhamnusium bicolor]|uniref:Uncharacterized protein n=1 Tax=Rhamnusium bicolor TaxID=1586634 RepID=A0AAV8ZKJ8_9CUCU|nr:hypothetical protein NQ314_005119 [Rhamnusium bicolor]
MYGRESEEENEEIAEEPQTPTMEFCIEEPQTSVRASEESIPQPGHSRELNKSAPTKKDRISDYISRHELTEKSKISWKKN